MSRGSLRIATIAAMPNTRYAGAHGNRPLRDENKTSLAHGESQRMKPAPCGTRNQLPYSARHASNCGANTTSAIAAAASQRSATRGCQPWRQSSTAAAASNTPHSASCGRASIAAPNNAPSPSQVRSVRGTPPS